MSRCFRVLGLTEHATKAQVEDAYRRRVARYKGPDYMEEPEYANRKLMELRGAYEEALRLAGSNKSSTSTRRISSTKVLERTSASNNTSKSSSVKRMRDGERNGEEHGFSEKFHQWLETQDDKKAERKNRRGNDTARTTAKKSSRSSAKAGMKKLSDKFPELKKLSAENLKSAWAEFKADAAGLAGADFEDDGFDPFAKDREEHRTESVKVEKPKEKKSGGKEILSIIATLLIAGMTLFGSCGEEDIHYDYEYDFLANYDNITEYDSRIETLAEGSRDQLYMQDSHGTSWWSVDSDEELRPIADVFAEKYWNMDSIEEVTEYLQSEYAYYLGDSSATLDQQLDHIFPFYGFVVVDEVQMYDQPYTGQRIQCYADYLEYLNQYYDEMQ